MHDGTFYFLGMHKALSPSPGNALQYIVETTVAQATVQQQSQDGLGTYLLMRCNQVKSFACLQARDTLVTSYKQLRAGDVTGGAVYRITVRQLEALIRLSEAHARVRCSDIIEPRDVREVGSGLQPQSRHTYVHILCSTKIGS